ncbi:hypothetical protein [Mycoplasma phocimorsus]|uniref:hypothetical protein n=1 Tax=Mycoplasma phocimorsus TaxID=3045839 RepID=UPI0024C02214|nr:hypothetical protein [Mycoplasma phocimorsus]MDJ1647296.1 hypothetical protein [Mycoplasma phocimorsus]
MKIKNMIKWISSTVGITSSFLISASVSNSHIYEIQYVNTVNIDVNNLTRKYNSNVETKLVKPKAKNGFIFSGWKLKNEKIIDTIAVGTQENIILSPVLINEYPNYSFIKNLFINSSSKINFDIRIIKIKQLITKEELAFGNEKYQLQKLIVEAINNFDNKLMHDTMNGIQFMSGSHTSNEVRATRIKASVSISNYETTSVWRLVWAEVKSWWNNWLGTAFYGLIGVGATIGIGYSAYTAYLKNKKFFKLKENEGLKITLEFFPEVKNKVGYWFGRFYNNWDSIKIDCLCQRRFKKNIKSDNNFSWIIEYILTKDPNNTGLLLYNLTECNDTGNENYDTKFIPIGDYYTESNEIPVFGYENRNKNEKRLGNLVITRKVITQDQIKNICNTSSSIQKCECKSSSCESDTIKKCSCIAIEENIRHKNS